MKRQKILRAGAAFVASGVLQLLGFVPYVLLSLKVTWTKQYKLSLALAGLGLLSLAYPPQRELSYRLLLGISGLTSSSQFSPGGPFTLLGSLSLSGYLSPFHPLLVVGGLVFAKVSLDAFRRRLHAESILLYTCLSAIVFLLLLSLPNKWIWLLPIGILYAILTDRDSLGAFMLVFGTAASFLIISTVGSSYFLFGTADQPLQPLVEGVRNGLQIFTIMITFLAGLFLAYLISSQHNSELTLITSSLLVIALYCMVYFWIGVYPI